MSITELGNILARFDVEKEQRDDIVTEIHRLCGHEAKLTAEELSEICHKYDYIHRTFSLEWQRLADAINKGNGV